MTSVSLPAVEDNKDEKAAPEAEDLLRNGTGGESGDRDTEISGHLKFRRESAYSGAGPAYSRRSRGMSLHSVHHFQVEHPTTYTETMINFIKANIGSGMFAMGDAVKNSGLLLGPILTALLGIMCVHCQHQLINASALVAKRFGKAYHPNFAETVELSFSVGPTILKRVAIRARQMSYAFLVITQIGFCCVYFVFISSNLKMVLDSYLPPINVHLYMAMLLPPILITAWIRSLKFLAPLSLIANVLMSVAVFVTLYLCIAGGLPPISERALIADWKAWPLFFGTVVYCFEGISMTMPIRNHMKNPKEFNKPLGVLNVGTSVVGSLLAITGFFSYWRFGDSVRGVVTLNLDPDLWLTKVVQVSICLSILFTYAMQAFVPVEILWSWVQKKFKPTKHKLLYEYLVRSGLVLFTFFLAECIPNLGLFISLVGAISSCALAFIFPPLMDWAVHWDTGLSIPQHLINAITITMAASVAIGGTYASMTEIVQAVISGKLFEE